MRLIIDIGNSKVKYYCQKKQIAKLNELESILPLTEEIEIFSFSTVPEITDTELANAQAKLTSMGFSFTIQHFDFAKDSRLKNLYSSMGPDRVVKLEAALNYFPGRDIALMDFGTATTLSLANAEFDFLGGFISEGFASALKTLSECSQIPDLRGSLDKKDFANAQFLGLDTSAAILNGSYQAHLALIDRWLDLAKTTLEQVKPTASLVTICTGGLAPTFQHKFDHYIPAAELLDSF